MLLLTALAATGCGDGYDDTRIKQDLDEIGSRIEALEQSVAELQSQFDALTQLINSLFVSFISTDAEGRTVITYMDHGGESHSITVATQEDVVTLPILSIAQDEDDIWYWRQTTDNGQSYEWVLTDGKKTPVGGTAPELGVDEEGYWTVNGEPLTDAEGKRLLAGDVSEILFRSAAVDEETGEALFVLADGTELRMPFFEALSLTFDTPLYTAIPDYTTSVKINYTVAGSQADGAIVELFTTYRVNARLDTSLSTLTVSLQEGATEGNLLVMAHANGNTVLKPLFFTYGTAEIGDPEHNGSTAEIQLEGDATSFDVEVSANITYEVSVSDEAAGWLHYNPTRAMTTTTHHFTADAYDSAAGTARTGEIRFANRLYNVSAAIAVKQSPKIPEGQAGGIATAADLQAFAAAVNSGASTERWQNDNGEVVLLNDIDMTGVENWTPIGGIDGSAYTATDPYTTVNPFKGTFDGQGFAILNLHYTADMASGRYGYALFGSVEDATIRNLTLGSPDTPIAWTFTGDAPKATCVASLVAYALNSTIESCTNYYDIDFAGDSGADVLCIASGLVGVMKHTTLGGRAKSLGCLNYGAVRTGKITNNGNGGNGMQTAGICGVMAKDEGNLIQYCVNYGHISCPTGRTGGLVATMMNGNVRNSDNRGTVEDDLAGKFVGAGIESAYNYKRMGGLIGGTDDLRSTPSATVESCTNYGNVLSHIGCRAGGFIGHSNVQIIDCADEGAVLGNKYHNDHGPGWACGYSAKSTDTWTNVRDCSMGGYVGDYEAYKENPTMAPAATGDNAFGYKNAEYYDPTINN